MDSLRANRSNGSWSPPIRFFFGGENLEATPYFHADSQSRAELLVREMQRILER